jgi:hypothetical protein
MGENSPNLVTLVDSDPMDSSLYYVKLFPQLAVKIDFGDRIRESTIKLVRN